MTLTITTTPTPEAERPSRTQVAVARSPAGGRVSVWVDADGPVERPVVRPVLLSSDDVGARICLVPEGALLLAGDRIEIAVSVGPGVHLELVEPGGTVAYAMDGGRASWDVAVDVGAGASLAWAAEPFVVAADAHVTRSTTVRLGVGAVAALREVLVLGRHGERSGTLEQLLTVTGPAGRPLLADGLEVGPATSRLLLGGARVVGSVVLAGARLPDDVGGGGVRFETDDPGTLVRATASAAHEAALPQAWRRARAVALASRSAVPSSSGVSSCGVSSCG